VKCYLRYDDGRYIPYRSKKEAAEAYLETALELDRYGQAVVAALHYSDDCDYPEWLLSLSKKGNVVWQRC
jgi:hypothetical protein